MKDRIIIKIVIKPRKVLIALIMLVALIGAMIIHTKHTQYACKTSLCEQE